MKLDNILRIADIHVSQITAETVCLIGTQKEVWTDNDEDTHEHIYSVARMLENISMANCKHPGEEVVAELEQIQKAMNRKDCSYLRIVYY